MKEKLISTNFIGNENSPHYHAPILAELKNISSGPLAVEIPSGTVFKAGIDEYQNIVVTKTELISLKPDEEREILLTGMCIENGDDGPGSHVSYFIEQIQNEELQKLVKFIEANDLQNFEGQMAVWNLTDELPDSKIIGYDNQAAEQLRNFLNDESQQGNTSQHTLDSLWQVRNTHMMLKLSGKFTFKLAREHHVKIAMFNERNIVIRELMADQNYHPGQHEFEYTFDASIHPKEAYNIKLLLDGEIVLTQHLDLSRLGN